MISLDSVGNGSVIGVISPAFDGGAMSNAATYGIVRNHNRNHCLEALSPSGEHFVQVCRLLEIPREAVQKKTVNPLDGIEGRLNHPFNYSVGHQ